MKKLLYIITLILLISSCSQKESIPKFWVWMHANEKMSVEEWDTAFQKINDAGIKGVLIGSNITVLERVIPIADKYNIEVHAWFWTMNRGEAKDEWLSVNRLGKSLAEERAYVDYYKFMCPAIPEVKDYLKGKIIELSEIKGLKGIHMDYVRYVDVILPEAIQPNYNIVQDHEFPEYDYGYHPYMRKLYKEKYGIDPIEIEDPENDKQWKQFRYDELTKTVNELGEIIKAKNMVWSAAVFPSPEIARTLVRQDWDKWKLDYAFPMVYNNFYNEDIDWIEEICKIDVDALTDNQKVFCGLYLPALKKTNEITKAVDDAFKGGASGIAFFDYRGIGEKEWEEIKGLVKKYK